MALVAVFIVSVIGWFFFGWLDRRQREERDREPIAPYRRHVPESEQHMLRELLHDEKVWRDDDGHLHWFGNDYK